MLRGASGCGKSDLALRLIDGGARLVADDQVELFALSQHLVARPPAALAGLLEVRGIGIMAIPHVAEVRVLMVVDMVQPEAMERMPEMAECELLGVKLRRLDLVPFETSAAAKLRLVLNSLVST